MRKILFLILLFTQFTFAQELPISCGTNDEEIATQQADLLKQLPALFQQRKLRKAALDDFFFCRVAVDVDYETFKRFNGDTVAIRHQVASTIQDASKIYEREISTKLVLVNVNIWKDATKDPYTDITDIFKLLNKLQTTYGSATALGKIQADVVMYLPSKSFSGAGGVASGKFNVSPWNGVSTIAHEIGHNFGSPHTQSCNWTGGPLDFCYAAESNCYDGTLENINGTIMSYCNRRLNTFHPMCITLMNANATSRYLRIKPLTETVTLSGTYPFNASTYVSWNPVVLAENYYIQLATDADFKNIIIKKTVQQAYTTLPELSKNATYFMRIMPSNRLGDGRWSNTMKIETPENVLATPKLLSPANNSTNIDGLSLILNFEPVEGATSYQLQYISYSSGATSITFDSPTSTRTITNTSLAIGTAAEALTWRVRAMQGTRPGAWSMPYTIWFKPLASSLDFTQQTTDTYPTSFPINYTAANGNIFQVSMKVSDKADFSSPFIQKKWDMSKYAGQNLYPFLLENLNPNTTYYVRFEEYNTDDNNIIGIPTGLVRYIEKSFKTGSEPKMPTIRYFNNSNVGVLSRTTKKLLFNDDYAFISTYEGIVRMKPDGSEAKLFTRDNTSGKVSNTLIDMKTDKQGNLWVLSIISKRIAFNGVFPKTTYRLAKLNPNTLETIEAKEFFGGQNASFSTFDTETQLLSTGSVLHKIVRDSTQALYKFDNSYSLLRSVVFNEKMTYALVALTPTNTYEILRIDNATGNITNFTKETFPFLTSTITQYYLDAQGILWLYQAATSKLHKLNADNSLVSFSLPAQTNTLSFIGTSANLLYVYLGIGAKKEIYSFDNQSFKKITDVPYSSFTSNFTTDNRNRIWHFQADRLTQFNLCNNIATPTLTASAVSIRQGESVSLKADGCTTPTWFINGVKQSFKDTKLTVSPTMQTVYKVQCSEDVCLSDFSNAIEINVVGLTLGKVANQRFCSNEIVEVNPTLEGKFLEDNAIKAEIYNQNKRYIASLVSNQVILPTAIESGKYFLKLFTTSPKIYSQDSVEIAIFQAPTAKISGISDIFLFDSTQIKIELSGTPPFKFNLKDETIQTSNTTLYRDFVAKEPINYVIPLSNLSDANCKTGIFLQKELIMKAVINPKYQNYWVQTFPVPLENNLQIQIYNKPSKSLSLDIFDIKGNKVLTETYPITSYLDKYSLDMSNFGAGVYFLKLNTGIRQETRKIIKR